MGKATRGWCGNTYWGKSTSKLPLIRVAPTGFENLCHSADMGGRQDMGIGAKKPRETHCALVSGRDAWLNIVSIPNLDQFSIQPIREMLVFTDPPNLESRK